MGLAGPIGRVGRACGGGFGVLKHLELMCYMYIPLSSPSPLGPYDKFPYMGYVWSH